MQATTGSTRDLLLRRDVDEAIDRAIDGVGGIDALRRSAQRMLDSTGVNHLFSDGGDGSHPYSWRLDPRPVLIGGDEWRSLADGVAQRARLHTAVLRDVLGPQRLLSNGIVPAEAVLGHPGFAWAGPPLADNGPSPLVIYGVDVLRTRPGEWRVTRELTDAPTGIGYALLNRSVAARLLPGPFEAGRVAGLDGFVDATRAALAVIAPADRPNPRTVVMTPGPTDRHYLEHSYLATTLGYHLAETGDLLVRDGNLWLRTLGGLERIDGVLRRCPGLASDPLDSGQFAGVAGLARLSRLGGVGLGNAIGAAVAESIAGLASLPGLCQSVLDEELLLAPIASSGRVVDPVCAADGSESGETGSADGEPVVIRLIAVLRGDIVTVMPGGVARVLDPGMPLGRRRDGLVRDVWIVDSGEATPGRSPSSNLRSEEANSAPAETPQIDLRTSLPTRAAEALFWTGRYIEQCESLVRLVSAVLSESQRDPSLLTNPELGFAPMIEAGFAAITGNEPWRVERTLHAAVADQLLGPGGLAGRLRGLQRATGSVRQFISATSWRVLDRLESVAASLTEATGDPRALAELLDETLVELAAFVGLVGESMVRGPAWRLLDLGRRIERAIVVLGELESMVSPSLHGPVESTALAIVLAANESSIAYRRLFRSDPRPRAVFELLISDETNPRALAFQLGRIHVDLSVLPAGASRQLLLHQIQVATKLTRASAVDSLDLEDRFGGRSPALDGLVIGCRAPIQAIVDSLTHDWFADRRAVQVRGGAT